MKQIIVTDRPFGYKPDKVTLAKLSSIFPDICVFGFGKYQEGFWYVLAHSEHFPINIVMPIGAVPMQEVFKWKPIKSPNLSLVPPSI